MPWLESTARILDDIIGVFSPARAYQRQAYREARNYDAAGFDRGHGNWRALTGQTAEQTNRGFRDIIRGRAQDLERNSDVTESIIGAYERNVVGTGFRLQSKIRNLDGTLNIALNAVVEDYWQVWSRPYNCDITGQQSLAELLRMAVRRKRVDGAALFVVTYLGNGSFLPLCLQAREVDELDMTLFRAPETGNIVINGVEVDDYKRPVAYHFRKLSPDGWYITNQTERIEARRVICWWDRKRPSQVREMSSMANVIERIADIHEFASITQVKQKAAATFAMFIKRMTPAIGLGRGEKVDTKTGYYPKKLTPGMVIEGQPGDEVSSVQGPNTAANDAQHINTMQRLSSAGQGLSIGVASRDLSGYNYSSARQERLEDRVGFDMETQALLTHVLNPIHEEFMISLYLAATAGVLSQKVNMPDFWNLKRLYFAHEFIPTGMPWVDPLKEANANRISLDTGQDTLANICAARGLDWEEVLEQRGREIARAKQLGVIIDTSLGSAPTK